MPRRLRSSQLETRTARLKLAKRGKPYWHPVVLGIAIGYRAGPGTWSVRAADGKGGNWIQALDAIADDHEAADGVHVLDFWQACDKAKARARGTDADAGRPATVAEAIRDYATDLGVRGAGVSNATRLLPRLSPALLSKPVSMLTVKELRHWRNGLLDAGLKASTINRLGKALKGALNLLAAHDDRIVNAKAWTVGLAMLPEADDTTSNLILTDEQRRDVVVAAYAIGAAFGIYVETHAATGARSSQIALLDVGDLETAAAAAPILRMPSSLKGRNRRTRTRKPIPISAGLAKRLRVVTAGRGASEPLLLNPDGERWNTRTHRRRFSEAVKAAGLPDGATLYCLRHTAITRALLAGIPIRLVASSFDTSTKMIEASYSKYIADHGDAQMRRALFDADASADGNVVTLVR